MTDVEIRDPQSHGLLKLCNLSQENSLVKSDQGGGQVKNKMSY